MLMPGQGSRRAGPDGGRVRVELGVYQAAVGDLEDPGVLDYHCLAGRLEDGRVGEPRDEVISGLDDPLDVDVDVDVERLPHRCSAGGLRGCIERDVGADRPVGEEKFSGGVTVILRASASSATATATTARCPSLTPNNRGGPMPYGRMGPVPKNPPESMQRNPPELGGGPIRVPAGLVVLVGPPASGKTSFVRALIARRQIDEEAVVSSDEIRAELFGSSPVVESNPDAADARIFEERDRRIVARLASGQSAVAESTNVTPQARERLLAIARRFNAPVTMLRFDPDLTELLQQHAGRGRTDVTAAEVRAYAEIMTQHASADQLRAEGATAVHYVPGCRQATTPAEAAAHFSFT
jgi:predicted kinase